MPRPHWTELELVTDGDLLVRFVQPGDYRAHLPVGARVQTGALKTDEFTPNDKSYGASVYAKSKLNRGIDDLYEACGKWRQWHFAELPVTSVTALRVEVRLSPQDCQFDEIRHAHASLIGVNRQIRNELIRIIERNLVVVAGA